MAGIVDCSDFCRLCLVKEQVNNPIFEDDGRNRQVHTKISTCLPVKVTWEDALPKRICDGCNYKLDQQFQFWSTSVNSEKQLKQWLGIVDEEEPKPAVKTKKEKLETSASKRPRRNARRKAVQNIRQAVAAQQQSDSDDGEPLASLVDRDSDFDYNDTITKEETNSENDFPSNNTDSVEPTTFVNVTLDNEIGQAGPSGIQKPSVADTGETEAPEGHVNYRNITIKPDPEEFEPLVTITELPIKKLKKSGDPRNLENVIKKLKSHSDSEDDDLTLAKLQLAAKTKKNTKQIGTRKKSVPKKIGTRKKRKESDTNENKQKKTLWTKIKEEPADESYEDEYQNPFNYGFEIPAKPARRRKPFNKSTPVPITQSKMKSKWSCLICLEDLASKEALIAHYAVHKDIPIKQEHETPNYSVGSHFLELTRTGVSPVPHCQVCGKSVDTDKDLRKHSETHIEERFHCEICDTSFKRAYEFSVHSRLHTEEPKLKCDMCDYETIYRSALDIHLKRHESDYKYKCEICGKGFFVQSWYEEHKNFHTGAKPFVCEICDKPFAYTRYLTAHKRSMHPESYRDEPVVNECEICRKRFAHKKSLMLHMKGHTGENTVLCDICGKRLSSNEHLKFHRRIHTGYKPYTCDVCSKGFAKKCNLTLHLRVHSGEKPYVCDVCGKCFSQRSTLVIHERYHTGQRPYTCHLCHKGFVAKGVLSIHLKSCNRHTIMGGLGILE